MLTKYLCNSLLGICFLAGLGLAQAQPGTARPAIIVTPVPEAPPQTRAAQEASGPLTVSPTYVIGANDQIKIDVRDANFNVVETESGLLPVTPDGKVTLPLLGDIQAAGFTRDQLAANITARIAQIVKNPTVTVSVMQVNSKVVFFAGEGASRAGPMQITPGMTILQAIATAGISPFANKKHIYILRGDPSRPQRVLFNYDKAVKKGDMQGVELVPGDTIVIP